MTAEIVIMNREAVALAADSAVSLMAGPGDRPQKIFTSADKIFELAREHSACIMIYNNAAFMGIPWQTLITIYRGSLPDTPFDTLEEYAQHFIDFLTKEEGLIPDAVQQRFFVDGVYRTFLFIRYLIQQNASAVLAEKGQISEEEIQGITGTIIDDIFGKLSGAPYSPTLDDAYAKELAEAYGEWIVRAASEVFERIPLTPDLARKLSQIAVLFYVKAMEGFEPLERDFSGVVFAGFGTRDLFPSMQAFLVEGMIRKRLKHQEVEKEQVGFENGAIIIPFAQREMVDIFISGLDPRFTGGFLGSLAKTFEEYPRVIIDSIGKLTDEEKEELKGKFGQTSQEIVQRIRDQLASYQAFNANPIVNVVAALPRSDLAAMAESLVNLTSLKRRVSLQEETVGGPVDVAVISRSDGFIWIKRKEYFRPELNPGYLAERAGREHGRKG
ncbi:MAG TPA: hypothetical protein VMS81_07330 [Methanomicrobiales archaeon]|nr:hypothetical protein [Methanomicrobiales archaeon]